MKPDKITYEEFLALSIEEQTVSNFNRIASEEQPTCHPAGASLENFLTREPLNVT